MLLRQFISPTLQTLIVCLSIVGVARCARGPATYTAALSQHFPVPAKATAEATLQANMQGYISDMAEAVSAHADILLYPEFGLFRPESRNQTAAFCESFTVTDPASAPCDTMNGTTYSVVKDMSCMARNASMYVMLNFCQRVPCSTPGTQGCPPDGQFLWNTNLVFTPTGSLLRVYRKSHVWLKKVFDQPAKPDLVTFDTPWASPVGMFLCFDILFPSPGPALRKQGVVTFVYDSFIPSTIIGKNAFRLWSWKNKAILIASNAAKGSGGVFIQGKQVSTAQGNILVATLPVNATSEADLTKFVDTLSVSAVRK